MHPYISFFFWFFPFQFLGGEEDLVRGWWEVVWEVVWEAIIPSLFILFLFVSVLFVIRIFLFNLRIIGRGRLVRDRQEARSWESG